MLKVFSKCPEFKSVHVCVYVCVCLCVIMCVVSSAIGVTWYCKISKKYFLVSDFREYLVQRYVRYVKNGPLSFCFPLSYICVCVCVCVFEC